MDKMREDFESAIKANFGDSIDYRRCENGEGEYMSWGMQVAWWSWQASRKAGKAVAYMTHHGSAVSPDDFKGGEEEMLFFAKVDGWTPLIIRDNR